MAFFTLKVYNIVWKGNLWCMLIAYIYKVYILLFLVDNTEDIYLLVQY